MGIDGLADDGGRSGRPKTVDVRRLFLGDHVGVASGIVGGHPLVESGLLGKYLGVGDATVARAWRRYGVKPWRRETLQFSTDPELEAKVRDVIGLYLNPPRNAIVLCVDEKSQIQALNRTQPTCPLRPGLPEKATHDYQRNDTAPTLFAALEDRDRKGDRPLL